MKTDASNAVAPAPQIIRESEQLRQTVEAARRAGRSVGLVPTMGALHEGHLSLVDTARAECDLVVVSVFVNPTQFSPQEDLNRYPRDLDRDLQLLRQHDCDIVFTPTVAEIYGPHHTTFVDVGPMAQTLEGEFRPHHFRGVATVVLKLFQIAPADRAYFGQKDYQQTLVVQKMVADLDVPIQIRVCPTVREPDGLAMSSRNAYLGATARHHALSLSQSLRLAEQLAAQGVRDVAEIRRTMMEHFRQVGGVDVQYIAFVKDGTVTPVTSIDGPTVVAVAARAGETRLIDNTRIG